MSPSEVSGIYKCTKCGNEITHVTGKNFPPCTCGNTKNPEWKLVRQTK